MINQTIPILEDQLFNIQLPNGSFVKINTSVDANGNYTVELLDSTGEFKAGLQSEA